MYTSLCRTYKFRAIIAIKQLTVCHNMSTTRHYYRRSRSAHVQVISDYRRSRSLYSLLRQWERSVKILRRYRGLQLPWPRSGFTEVACIQAVLLHIFLHVACIQAVLLHIFLHGQCKRIGRQAVASMTQKLLFRCSSWQLRIIITSPNSHIR